MIRFSKYHGCGKDFIIVIEEDIMKFRNNMARLVTQICSRRTGVGADGLIVLRRSPLEMIVYNYDGTVASMCGNDVRCFAHYCFDDDIIPVNVRDYRVRTDGGNLDITVKSADPFITEINMGMPDFSPEKIGRDCKQEELVNLTIEIAGEKITMSSLFMKTINTVVWIPEAPWVIDKENGFEINKRIAHLGERISEHPLFKKKTNVNFACKLNSEEIKLITYEAGLGYTAASGTGACATVVMGALERKLNKKAKVLFPYGELEVRLEKDGVRMIGPAERIIQGRYYENKF